MRIARIPQVSGRFSLLPTIVWIFLALPAFAQIAPSAHSVPQGPTATSQDTATLEADHQSQAGHVYYADGNVDVRYQNVRLRADHVAYNEDTQVVTARGHVQLDYETQHVEAAEARYEIRTGKGTFWHVRATFAMQRKPTPTLLISPNPLYFEAERADRIDPTTYKVHKAWLTVCDPGKPTWKFYAPTATVRLKQTVHVENGNFRLYSIPVLYLPYATFPAEQKRVSGFMIPDIGESSRKGFVFGDQYYWAPTSWMDASIGAAYFSKRGWSQTADVRMKPWENTSLTATYFGVLDRGLPQDNGTVINQGGHEITMNFSSLLPDGWRAVADLDLLTSLTFRLAWSETYAQAVNSEVKNNAFLTKNFRGFSLNLASLSYQNFLSATPETSITLRTAPEVEFSSVDQSYFRRLPIYFSFDSFVGAVHRGEDVTPFTTPAFVDREEIAPTVTVPLHFGDWLNVTPSFTFRATHYGGQLLNGNYSGAGFFRDTEEFTLDLRPPTLERVWGSERSRWKHTIEPQIVYTYVNGVDDYARFIRFDEDETLTDTNQIQYGFTQRLFHRATDGGTQELASWQVAQQYYFDPTFGGALISGQRNVFQATDSLTPFAFADTPRHFSPIVSDLRITPGKKYDTEFIVNYDTQRGRMTAIGTLLKLKPYKESFLTLADFSTINIPEIVSTTTSGEILQPRSNQIRALIGYGDLTRPGWNATVGASYDLQEGEFQNQIVQIGYNGKCCGLGFEYRKLSFGAIRNENQFRIVFLIANLGSAGNLRRQEKIF
ncbi:MAG TPA: LPS assembly protein LptD [Candidatus Acidoferrum sp.]|nr:LPS assembly protein LptD [Candidatus Acidoferrum sp.]